MSIYELFEFYRDNFVPAYSDAVAFTWKKETQSLIELENCLAHIAQYHNPSLDQEIRDDNLKKANDHLIRVTLDSYKVVWLEMNNIIDGLYSDDKIRAFATNISEEEFIKRYKSFKENARTARLIELRTVGNSPLDAVKSYKEVILDGNAILGSIDVNKYAKLEKHKRIIFAKEVIIAYLIGVASGMTVNVVWGLDAIKNFLGDLFGCIKKWNN